jgi:ABC-type branched-subunit amino acid transport system ATPase component
VVLTSVAGPLILLQQQIITPALFTADQFLKVYLMIMLGGLATLGGPALGAWIVGAMPEWLGAFGEIDPNVQSLVFAVLLVFFVLVAKRGLLGSLQHWLLRPEPLANAVDPVGDSSVAGEDVEQPVEAPRGAAAIDAVLGGSGSRALHDEVILEVKGLSHAYGANKVLDGVDLEIRAGEVRGLIGPNGSGKTTTLNCVSGFVSPTRASVLFLGKEMSGRRFDQVAGQGLVRTFQQPEVFGDFSARDTIELVLRATGAAGCGKSFNTLMPDDADYYLRLCMLDDVADQPSSSLPYGHARLLGVAAALATRPRLLMLDEPAAGLGSLDRVRLAQVIREARELDVAIVLVDHDMSFLLPLCDRLTVLDYGRKIAEGEPHSVCRDQEVVAAYLGTGFAERHSLELSEENNG